MSDVLRVTQSVFERIFTQGGYPLFKRLIMLISYYSFSWYLLIPVILLIIGSVIGFIKRIIHS